MHLEHEEPVGSSATPSGVCVAHGIEVPDEVIEVAMCMANKAYTDNEVLREFLLGEQVIKYIREVMPEWEGPYNLSAVHVHIGDKGLTPHVHNDEFPVKCNVVVFLTEASGRLFAQVGSNLWPVKPKLGRLVMMTAGVVHWVEPSPQPELRMTLVGNYE